MRILIFWQDGRKVIGQATYNTIFENFVNLAYERKVHLRKLKHGTWRDVNRRYMLLEIDGENIHDFLQSMKAMNYEIYQEVDI